MAVSASQARASASPVWWLLAVEWERAFFQASWTSPIRRERRVWLWSTNKKSPNLFVWDQRHLGNDNGDD